jgi:hypothetical protein
MGSMDAIDWSVSGLSGIVEKAGTMVSFSL